jgi:leucyl-tRNA synthetase
MREIKEETGYTNIEYVKDLGMEQHNHFFAAHKDVNRYAIGQGMLFKLINDEKSPVSEEDTKNHKTIWIKRGEMGSWLNLAAFKLMWDAYVSGSDCFAGDGKMMNSGKFNDKDSNFVKKEITTSVGGKWVTKYKLRDWVFSRQRYWGEPIPLIHCDKCGVVPVPEKDLPVKLPKVKSYEPTGTGESPLAAISKWVNVKCPKCKGPAKRETNTMPQWAGSCWYYLRYEDPKNKKALVDPRKEKYWSPVDLYVGGAEHATRHLIYARFWHKFLNDIGAVSTSEPFTKLQSVGLIMGEDGRKMSKRFGNVVNPDDIVKQFGADTLRIYEMFMGPFDQAITWSTESIVGPRRFIEKFWKLANKVPAGKGVEGHLGVSEGEREQPRLQQKPTASSLEAFAGGTVSPESLALRNNAAVNRIINKTIKKVTEDIAAMRFNTAISTLMIAVNELEKAESLSRPQFETLLKLIAPFAPHVTEELWTTLGNKKSIHISEWPEFDPKLIADEEANIVVQINGKVRASFKVAADSPEEQLRLAALALPEVKKWLEGKQIKKIIVVKSRLISIVAL